MTSTYTLYIAVSQDTERGFEKNAFFAYLLVRPDGAEDFGVRHYKEPVRLYEGEDPHYEAIKKIAPDLPIGSALVVISSQQHYHGKLEGKGAYPGTLNTSRNVRREQEYLKTNGDPIDKADSLRLMDEELERRDIQISGRLASELTDKGKIKKIKISANYELAKANALRDGWSAPHFDRTGGIADKA